MGVLRRAERGGKAKILSCEQGSEPAEFWEKLGGQGSVAPATSDDAAALEKTAPKLIKVSDDSGALTTTEIATGELKRSMLGTSDVYILDNGAEIYVWVGKGASTEERKGGMAAGTKYASDGGRPAGTKVKKVMENAEPTMFKNQFGVWEAESVPMPGRTPRGGSIARRRPSRTPRAWSRA